MESQLGLVFNVLEGIDSLHFCHLQLEFLLALQLVDFLVQLLVELLFQLHCSVVLQTYMRNVPFDLLVEIWHHSLLGEALREVHMVHLLLA